MVCNSTSSSAPRVHRLHRLQRQRRRLHRRRHFLRAVTIPRRLRQAPSSPEPPTPGTIAMIAPPLLRSHSRSPSTGSPLLLRTSPTMALWTLQALRLIRPMAVCPCRICVGTGLFFRFRAICAPIRYRRIAPILPVAAACSPRSRARRPTGSLTLNGGQLILAEAAQPTLKFASTRA